MLVHCRITLCRTRKFQVKFCHFWPSCRDNPPLARGTMRGQFSTKILPRTWTNKLTTRPAKPPSLPSLSIIYMQIATQNMTTTPTMRNFCYLFISLFFQLFIFLPESWLKFTKQACCMINPWILQCWFCPKNSRRLASYLWMFPLQLSRALMCCQGSDARCCSSPHWLGP